jgi:hypothetical protein
MTPRMRGTVEDLPAKRETLVRSILWYFDHALPHETEAGARWYPTAQAEAQRMADDTGTDLTTACSVIAATSPRVEWRRNLEVARAVLERRTESKPFINVPTRNVIRGEMALVAEWVQSDEAPKIDAFRANLLGDLARVTIDQWAIRAACWSMDCTKPLARRGRYAHLEGAYQKAARDRGVKPAVMQATCWCVIRGQAV